MNDKQIKLGIVFSYILIIANALYGLLLTPYVLGCLGEAEYGVYKTIASLSSALMVLDIGIGGTVMRYVASYRAKKDEEKIPNFLFMMFFQAIILCALVGVVGIIVGMSINSIYHNTFADSQLQKAKLLFTLMIINMGFHIVENVLNGIITGYNRFAFGNGLKLIRLLSRIILIYFVLPLVSDSLVLVVIDLSLTIIFLVIEVLFVKFMLHIRIRFSKWDSALFFESGKYTLLMFLTSIAAQVNNNLDNVVIGAIKGPNLVTIYSMGLLIFSTYEHLSTSVSGVMLPTVSNIIEDNNASIKLERLVIRAGRIQFVFLGAVVVGFICIGKEFIHLWLGKSFDDVYIITLILMIPSLFELCVNVCLAILRAKNMLTFRTIVLSISTVLNAIITIILVRYWSYIGAAIGTATSFIIGSLIIMNVYYIKVLGLNMAMIYGSIVKRTWVCLVAAAVPVYILSRYIRGNWASFIVKVVVFAIIYSVALLKYGLDKTEINNLPIINKIIRR